MRRFSILVALLASLVFVGSAEAKPVSIATAKRVIAHRLAAVEYTLGACHQRKEWTSCYVTVTMVEEWQQGDGWARVQERPLVWLERVKG